jgi:hypothetical protein
LNDAFHHISKPSLFRDIEIGDGEIWAGRKGGEQKENLARRSATFAAWILGIAFWNPLLQVPIVPF